MRHLKIGLSLEEGYIQKAFENDLHLSEYDVRAILHQLRILDIIKLAERKHNNTKGIELLRIVWYKANGYKNPLTLYFCLHIFSFHHFSTDDINVHMELRILAYILQKQMARRGWIGKFGF